MFVCLFVSEQDYAKTTILISQKLVQNNSTWAIDETTRFDGNLIWIMLHRVGKG